MARIFNFTAIALPCAWALRRLVEAELFGVSAFDSPTIALASGLLAGVALSAAMISAGGLALRKTSSTHVTTETSCGE
jgi:hypothetical protein